MVCVFSSVVEDQICRAEESSTNDGTSAQIGCCVKFASIMLAGESALRCDLLGCVCIWDGWSCLREHVEAFAHGWDHMDQG